ncbi:MAG: TIGR04283 family arsenosugar biosynthesis glycosyltransferase [Leptolyngbyaceae cyanobacterium bins.302]|nr:TIGR04283 family arsenosugar biosynthesis glycosyltransferase [Leptolyngbyaceae cyanobacterium bins.302]
MVTLSVIIPVRDEAVNLPATLAAIALGSNLEKSELEVIVVDGGSRDDSIAIAKQFGAVVIQTAPGRAQQMNAGATIAQGKFLLFLHGDTLLPANFAQYVEHTLNQPGVVAGAFDLNINGAQKGLRWVEWGVRWRSRFCQLPYGDQAIFLTAQTFHALGGFPDLPIMEDFVLVQQLKRLGKIAIVPAVVHTSNRRWQRLGVVKTTTINQIVILGYYLGISPKRLAAWYRRLK